MGKKKVQKRNKGKKFKYMGNKDKEEKEEEENPFETMTKTKFGFKKAVDQRQKLLEEFHNRAKSSAFRDRRIGNDAATPAEQVLQKRFVKEQKEQIKASQKIGKTKSSKYNLEDETDMLGEGAELGGLTHKGKLLQDMDDFREDIAESSSDEEGPQNKKHQRRPKGGELEDDVVQELNFGSSKDKKKSRKEVFEEIIAKNKLYRMQRSENKETSQRLVAALDEDFGELYDDIAELDQK